MSIQNRAGFEIKLNYVNTGGYVGIVVPDKFERYYDIKDTIVMYARAITGGNGAVVTVEEIS